LRSAISTMLSRSPRRRFAFVASIAALGRRGSVFPTVRSISSGVRVFNRYGGCPVSSR
jgi:hypothetical protein